MNIFKSTFADLDFPVSDAASVVLFSDAFERSLEKNALIDTFTGDSLTFQELRENSLAFGTGLRTNLNFSKGDVLALFSPNSVHFSTIVFGTLLAGGTITTANSTYTVDELAYQLKDANASVLVVGHENIVIGKAAAEIAGIPSNRIFVINPEDIDGVQNVYDIYAAESLPKVELTEQELAEMPAYLTYSSGTTGRSKGVITTHKNMVANIIQTFNYLINDQLENDVWSGVLPFFHMYGLNVLLHIAPYAGIPVAVMPSFDFIIFLKAISTHKISTLYIVPPIIIGLAKHPIVAKFDVSSVKRIVSGAAPLSRDIEEAVSTRLGAFVMQGYGLTETTPIIAMSRFNNPVHGTIGILAANMEARIVDPDTGLDLGYDEPGELWVRGPNVMKGYHNNPTATAEAIDADGFFHTGDVATIAQDGHIRIVDRLKELIKYAGLQVPPAELEAKLLTYPKIADAAVIGIPDETVGEVPIAYVVLHPGQTATEDEIKEFIKARVADHKKLHAIIFAESIPKAASGKILRRILRAKDAERRAALAAQ
eukprot:jgi/Hompol1/6754/HPOL_002337-RA